MTAAPAVSPQTREHLGPSFSLLWFGEGVSLLGTAITSVLLPLLAVTELQAGPGWMGLITAASWLPWLIIGLPAGAWLDRSDPRRVMILADLVAAGALASVPLVWWFGRLTLVQLAIVATVGGACTVFLRTGYVKLLPRIVPDSGLETANARVFGTESAMHVAGPGAAGLVVQVASAATGFVGSVIGLCVSALCLARIRVRDAGEPPPALVGGLRTRIAEGIRTVLGDANLRVLMIIGGISNFGLTGYAALLVLFLVGELGLSGSEVSVVIMIGGAGGLVGAVVAPWLGRRLGSGRASTALLVAGGPSALLVAAPTSSEHVYLTAAGLVLVGAAVVGGNVIRGAWRQRYVPAELMGRVMTTMQVVNYGTMPLAGLAAALLGSALGVQPAIVLLAGVHAVACLSVLATRLGRARILPAWRGVGVAE